MSLKRHLRNVLACALLEAGALMGAPMRMEQVTALLRALSQPTIAHTNPQRDEQAGDDGEPGLDRPPGEV